MASVTEGTVPSTRMSQQLAWPGLGQGSVMRCPNAFIGKIEAFSTPAASLLLAAWSSREGQQMT